MQAPTVDLSLLFDQLPTGLFLVTTVIFILFSLSLVYHVRQYSLNQKRAKLALSLYTIVSGILFVIAGLALYTIS